MSPFPWRRQRGRRSWWRGWRRSLLLSPHHGFRFLETLKQPTPPGGGTPGPSPLSPIPATAAGGGGRGGGGGTVAAVAATGTAINSTTAPMPVSRC